MKHLIKLIHVSLFMNATFSLLKNQIYLVIKKKRIWFRKIRSVFKNLKKKWFFEEKNSDLCLLKKTKSFDLKIYQIYFLRIEKKWFLICKRSDLFCDIKIYIYIYIRFVYFKKNSNMFLYV